MAGGGSNSNGIPVAEELLETGSHHNGNGAARSPMASPPKSAWWCQQGAGPTYLAAAIVLAFV